MAAPSISERLLAEAEKGRLPYRPRRFLACSGPGCTERGEVAPESPVQRWLCPACLRLRDTGGAGAE